MLTEGSFCEGGLLGTRIVGTFLGLLDRMQISAVLSRVDLWRVQLPQTKYS